MSRVTDAQIASVELAASKYDELGVPELAEAMRRLAGAIVLERDRADLATDASDLWHRTAMSACAREDEQRALADRYLRKLDAVRKFADELADYCSPNGVALEYANRLRAVLDADA